MKNIKRFNQFVNEGSFEDTSYRPQEETVPEGEFKYMYNVNVFINGQSEDECEQILLDIENNFKDKIQLGFYEVSVSPKMNVSQSVGSEEMVEEGIFDTFKKGVGQQKEWVLDGSYLTKASQNAKNDLATHPTNKPGKKGMYDAFIRLGMSDSQSKEAILRTYDWGGKIDFKNAKFDKESNKLVIEPPKGTSNPNPAG